MSNRARLNLEYTTIRSPVDGKTGPMLIQPGNMVRPLPAVRPTPPPPASRRQSAGHHHADPAGQDFVRPAAVRPAAHPGRRWPDRAASPSTLNMHDAGGDDFTAPVNFVSNAWQATTGTIELRASFPIPICSWCRANWWMSPWSCRQIPHATVVPRDAVNTGPDGQFVYVVKDGVAEQRPVKLDSMTAPMMRSSASCTGANR